MIVEVPELWDGGYWYELPVTTVPGEGPDSRAPDGITANFCAWYHPTEPRCIVRTIEALVIPEAVPISGDIPKGYGRIEGR